MKIDCSSSVVGERESREDTRSTATNRQINEKRICCFV